MAYEGFALYYDALNEDANYDALAAEIGGRLAAHNIHDGIVADLGCGTGELTLRLAAQGYDMLAIDSSPDMLNMLREKMTGNEKKQDILLLCQRLEALDLFGTIRAAVSTFDTFNHLPPSALQKSIEKIALFMEPDGLLIFDMNTPYKHQKILKNNTFIAESAAKPGVICEWENTLNKASNSTDICLEIQENNTILFSEYFTEYYYYLEDLIKILNRYSFAVQRVCDGETFFELKDDSQRMLVVAKRIADTV